MKAKSVHAGVPMPKDYVEMMRHYFPNLPLPAIRDAWLHHATPKEVALSMERAKGK